MPLQDLPTEITAGICSYLETRDLSSLRLTCNALLQRSQQFYGDHNYRAIWMIVTSDSLRQLQRIARHDYFKTCVKELTILPILFDDHGLMSRNSFQGSSFGRVALSRYEVREDQLQTRYEAYEAIVADHENAMNSLQSTLESCLPHFINLASFKLRPMSTEALIGADIPYIPSCLGLRQFRSQMASRLSGGGHLGLISNKGASRVGATILSVLFKAIIASNRCVKELYTCANECGGGSLAKMTLTSTQWKAFISLMKNAECLHLGPQMKEEISSYDEFMDLVLACAPNLRFLSITDNMDSTNPKSQYFPSLSEPICFSRLRELHLSTIEASLGDFKSFLQTTAPTLKSLTLQYVNLSDRVVSSSMPTVEKKKSGAERLWRDAWNFLRDEFSLRLLCMTGLAYQDIEVRVNHRLWRLSGQALSLDVPVL
ncbi:hypothetical protein N7490_000294 [Penicillium lividum]|nr:hypothetical protein N7490_000294 [Penicillium lividum]